MEVKVGYDYDDVLLIPKNTNLVSRSEINMHDNQGVLPIFSSPMKGISGLELVSACGASRIYGILHRFDTLENRIKAIDSLCETSYNFYSVAVGVTGEEEMHVAKYAWEMGAEVICVDVANGYLKLVADFVERLRENGINKIMAGNVVTREGADCLVEAGATFIRVGIGGGSLCSTRNVTGIGIPDLTAIEDVNLSRYRNNFYLVADGGIRNSGNAVKAFATGADYVMLGSYLAQAFEAEHTGRIYGMASAKVQFEMGKEIISVEGFGKEVEKIAPLEDLVDVFVGGIRSACTYLNSPSYRDIRYNADFISAGKGSIKQL